jgi:hypothetical protein
MQVSAKMEYYADSQHKRAVDVKAVPIKIDF